MTKELPADYSDANDTIDIGTTGVSGGKFIFFRVQFLLIHRHCREVCNSVLC